MSGSLVFALNGQRVEVKKEDVDPGMTLNEFIRRHTRFTGTKLSCGEGGCGICAVDMARYCPKSQQVVHMSVNSCLRLLCACDGYSITTTEGIGNSRSGFHPIQERIVHFNGSQCGYCTPGMVMTLYSTLKQKPSATMEEIEARFDGNICRCTGYRAILDAAKSFASDSNIVDHIMKKSADQLPQYVPEKHDPAFPEFLKSHEAHDLHFAHGDHEYYSPTSMESLFGVLEKLQDSQSARFVVGNTSVGIYKKDWAVKNIIDIGRICELRSIETNDSGLVVGAAVAIHNFINALMSAAENQGAAKTGAFQGLAEHATKIANVHVRHAGSIAGNMVLAKTKGFLSDLATILLGANVSVNLVSKAGKRTVSMAEFLAEPVFNKGELIHSILVPFSNESYHFSSYRTSIRPQNSHAWINAAFGCNLENGNLSNVTLAFGGVMPDDELGSHAVRASRTEEFLNGKSLNNETLKEALAVLKSELVPVSHRHEFRHRLVSGFFYKFFVGLVSEAAEQVKSAVEDTSARPLTSAHHSFHDSPNSNGLVSKPIKKFEGNLQASGEAIYTDDLPMHKDAVFGALVTSTSARAKIVKVDPSRALAYPGVVGYVDKKDIPPSGKNNCSAMGQVHPVFADDKVVYYGQPIGMILAENERAAQFASKLVDVTYEEDGGKASLSAQQSLQEPEVYGTPVKNEYTLGDAGANLEKAEHRLKGCISMSSQKHFYMENQAAYAIPDEDGSMVIHVANQWPDAVQGALASVLGVPLNKVRVIHRRAGGAFGGKLTASIAIASCATIGANALNRPCRLALDRNTDMGVVGGREEVSANYEVAFDKDGKIVALVFDGTIEAGFNLDLSWFTNFSFPGALNQVYYIPHCKIASSVITSNKCTRTVVRGPGEIEASFAMESIIERIAVELNLSPDKVREVNFYSDKEEDAEKLVTPNGKTVTHLTIHKIWKQLKDKANYEERCAAVKKFNSENRWKKKGISITPVRYEVSVWPKSALVNIYGDGSVVVTHSSIEMGQGLNTKVVQFVSYELGKILGLKDGIPMERIRIGDTDTNITPNAMFTGGSTGSEGTAEAARRCCEELCKRMQPILDGLKEKEENKDKEITWEQLCAAAKGASINLSVSEHWSGSGESSLIYNNYGAAVSEVLVDILTGETSFLACDMIYDCGISLNPLLDIGQCEGAFMMGVGHFLREQELYEPDGRLVSNGTWEYKPPLTKDVPLRFSVELLENTSFDKGILSSKAVGEPPLVLATSVIMAVRQAVASARADAGLSQVFDMPVPSTPDEIQRLASWETEQLTV